MIINLHDPTNKNIRFKELTQELLEKEKILLELGRLKYVLNPFTK